MSTDRLRTELRQIEQGVETILRYSRDFGVPLPTGSDPSERDPMNLRTFAEQQRQHLEIVEKTAIESLVGEPDLCLFLGGSLARLEFLPGLSDLDFLAVTSSDDPFRRRPHDESELAAARVQWNRFARLRRNVARRLRSNSEAKGVPGSKADIAGKPLAGGRSFFTKGDLFRALGRDREPSWAGWARVVLLYEAAAWGDRNKIDELRQESDRTYGATEDLLGEGFPAMSCCFNRFMSTSGLLAKLGLLRKESPEDGEESIRKAEAELAKAFFSRQWYSAVNRMLLHCLYWSVKIGPTPWRTGPGIQQVLRSTPLAKLLLHMPTLLNQVHSDLDVLRRQLRDPSVQPREFTRRMNAVGRSLGQRCRRAGEGVPFWYRFLQVMQLCLDVRRGSARLDESTLLWMTKVGAELEKTLSDCVWCTRALHGPSGTQETLYQKLAAYVAAEIG